MNRRTFLKIAAMGSLAFAPSCSEPGDKNLFSLVHAPDDMVTGRASWYATTCRECPAGCGVLGKNREGRLIKLEGNPLHPVNRGKLCIRGQAALQGIYNPDRLKTPLLKQNGEQRPISYEKAVTIIKEKISRTAASGDDRIHMISRIEGESLRQLFDECASKWRSPKPLIFEPFGYENLRKASDIVFNINGLPRYRLDKADFLLGFGADFLETWLSPVEYARKFKKMHRFQGQDRKKGMFIEVSPCRTLTGANADMWMPCRPGGETAVCLGLIREVLSRNKRELTGSFREAVWRQAKPYTRDKVIRLAGIDGSAYDRLTTGFINAGKPLVIGTGSLSRSNSDLQTNIAVNLLNYIMDGDLSGIDFRNRHPVETAAPRSEVVARLTGLPIHETGVLLLNNVNPVHTMPSGLDLRDVLQRESLFVVLFSSCVDDTASYADLVFPVSLPLESWGEYSGHGETLSTLQPAMTPLHGAPDLGDVFMRLAGKEPEKRFRHYLFDSLKKRHQVDSMHDWLTVIRDGGRFNGQHDSQHQQVVHVTDRFRQFFQDTPPDREQAATFIGIPSIRFYDGRGANRPWLWEIPEPVSKVAWQDMLLMHPDTARAHDCRHEDIITLSSQWGELTAPVFVTNNIARGLFAMHVGQGHTAFGRYAQGRGANPVYLLPPGENPVSGSPLYAVAPVEVKKEERRHNFANTDGSENQFDRKIALTIRPREAAGKAAAKTYGLAMNDFPLTVPLPQGYDKKRDFYPPHDHTDYRWAMVVDLDRCVGCNACAAACYAENNIGVVGEDQVLNGREMSWMRIERYRQTDAPDNLIFLPMLCQHCDNAPCEAVCPVYAPHHSKEGLNNQIYNRCIGTRFCAQNCPYKVRRFNWFTWPWPKPMHLQLNPDVTVRSKGVMEKCSFCVQRIKAAHGIAKDEKRMIKDGEVTPACAQTCPTEALFFGSLMDPDSRVSKLVKDRRAYQVMGYLNTKPAVIYLKKVVHDI